MEKDGKPQPLPQRAIDVDENYLAVLGIPLLAGHNFSLLQPRKEKPEVTINEVLVNEALVKKMGWGPRLEAALGKVISQGPIGQETWHGRVVGVIKDFHFQALQKPIEPMVLLNNAGQFPQKVLIRLSASQLQQQISLVEQQWRKIVPNHAFDAAFLDATFEQQYHQERRLVTIFTYFSLLTIFVACLGLYGRASLTTAQRTKEIGVRKVMGASMQNLMYLLSRKFLQIIGVSFALASPLAWLVMNRWLQNFAYHTSIGWEEFVLAEGAVLLIAVLVTGYHVIWLARTNPAQALRHE